ncbi:electron transfer flavoprotein beta subunit lysine methyltransferase [Poecilia reticulata]|uniref:Electron transfer flavoprotein beta subunit lysine methyltransferase n=1 Tax=Poecilia reticulata TaxID=8081 RepID=A0A3P9Q9Z7_POERE|nr:PREDICTED: electron transfer flavoprotein beta subunit lysine methyltransferase [Poecilia reticulata]
MWLFPSTTPYCGFLSAPKCYRCVKGFLKPYAQTSRRRRTSESCLSYENVRSFILENTEVVVGGSLTPEIKLRLFTPNCRFWRERPELWPFSDPYWAIYWPGGQALSRYILDNPDVCRDGSVLDLGSGCGASAIAAKLCGAAHVVANDIDPVAAVVTKLNCELNKVEPPDCVTDDIIGSDSAGFDLILLGDMFYDETLSDSLHKWLDRCIKSHGSKVLIGDPGRAQFEGHDIRKLLHHVAQFELPESVRQENYGLTSSHVWCYHSKL